MLSFINQAVVLDQGCGDPSLRAGWYAQLFFDTETAPDYDPTIADVHTQPTDEVASPVGRVLHVATGMPRLMVVAVDTCAGPRAYAGLASSYFEKTTERFERLNDEDWANSIRSANPDDVSWLSDVVTRSEGRDPYFPNPSRRKRRESNPWNCCFENIGLVRARRTLDDTGPRRLTLTCGYAASALRQRSVLQSHDVHLASELLRKRSGDGQDIRIGPGNG